MTFTIRLCVALLSLIPLTGCLPNTVTLSLGGGSDELRSATVIEDEGARDKVAMIEVQGMIADAPRAGLIGTQPSQIDYVVRRLEAAEKDDGVKAVVLRINSPGGTVTGSDILYSELRRFSEVTGKPVVASMGEVAASGGYYIALGADEIIAEPTTITGSIGVIFATFNFSEGMSRIGIKARSVTSGPNKAMASPFEPIDEDHYEIIQSMVDEFYVSFRSLVLERRPNIEQARIDELTDGRVVTGAAAAATGLVDANGGVRDAFARAKSLAGIEKAKLVRYHVSRQGPKTIYAEAPGEAPTLRNDQISLLEINLGADAFGRSPAAYYLWIPGGI